VHAEGTPNSLPVESESTQCPVEDQPCVVDKFLDFPRMRTGRLSLNRSQVDAGALIIDLVGRLGAGWRNGSMRLNMESPHPLVCLADRLHLEQIAGRLLENAIKFSASGGQVTVRMASEGGFFRLSVADRGCGIAPEFLPHVFGLFKREPAVRAPGELGSGLALVHGLTVAHGGFVKATSAGPGQGAEFSVWLPLVQR
jgi:signal transduction histidine kinase